MLFVQDGPRAKQSLFGKTKLLSLTRAEASQEEFPASPIRPEDGARPS